MKTPLPPPEIYSLLKTAPCKTEKAVREILV